MRILVVEDEPRLLRTLAKALREEGYAVDTAEAGDDGLFKAESYDYDAMVLDVMLPRLDGWQLLERLRKTKQTPVLMLTARDASKDRVRGLDTGADDYLVKPFDLPELLARLRALIRRAAGQSRPQIEIGEVVIDTRARTVMRAGQPVIMTAREYAILEYLALHRGELVTRTALYEHLFDQAETNGFYFATWSRDGTAIRHSTNAPGVVPLPERVPDTLTHTRMRGSFREAFHFTEMGDCVLAGRSIIADLAALRRFTFWLLVAGGTVLAFGLGGGWWLTTCAVRPVEVMSAAASRISAGNLSERIEGAGADNELGRLAGVLNSTFARLEAAFAQQKQFTADASHELRTPLAVIISEAQTTLSRERSAAEYRETVAACLDTAQQMRQLTESLLELARFDAAQEKIPRARLDLAEQARAGVERVAPLAAQHGVQMHCELGVAEVVSHAERLGQVMTNLLSNAIHYNRTGGSVNVTTRVENAQAVLTVSDTGQGIAPEELPHIFERFYRADKSRSRAEGRSGLGLAICKAILDAEGGSIEVKSESGAGAIFTVRLPGAPRTNASGRSADL